MKDRNLLQYKEIDPQSLIKRRCFLGWVKKADIVIGTKDFSYSSVGLSGAQAVPTIRRLHSHSITMGISGMGIWTAEGTRTWFRISAVRSYIMLQAENCIVDTLADGRDEQVLLYDTTMKTGWYIPRSNVVLHLAQQVIKHRKYRVFDGQMETNLPYSSRSADGPFEATEALKRSLSKNSNCKPFDFDLNILIYSSTHLDFLYVFKKPMPLPKPTILLGQQHVQWTYLSMMALRAIFEGLNLSNVLASACGLSPPATISLY
jgi:hypothetical protein